MPATSHGGRRATGVQWSSRWGFPPTSTAGKRGSLSPETSREGEAKIVQRIRESVTPGQAIPKPAAKSDFTVKGWGQRRGEEALIYLIPNHGNPERPYQKGITCGEFERAYQELQRSGELSRNWFKRNLAEC